MEIRKDYYPEDIALALCKMADKNFKDYDEYGESNPLAIDVQDALYQLMAICENEHNFDYYRTLWDVLQNISERFWDGLHGRNR